MKSGILAAEATFAALTGEEASETKGNLIYLIFGGGGYTFDHCLMFSCIQGIVPKSYEEMIRSSWIWSELKKVRNIRPSFHTSLGLWGGMAYSGFSILVGGREPWTLKMNSKFRLHLKHV